MLTDSVAKRIENIERIIDKFSTEGVSSFIEKILPVSTLAAMRELNQSRNAFSHSAAQSETQARGWISECYAEVMNIFSDLSGLENIRIVRYLNHFDGVTLRCEIFRGHGSTRTIQKINISQQQASSSVDYFQQDQILVVADEFIFGLRPMIFFREDDGGHATRLCVFRRAKGGASDRRFEYEIIGKAARHEENRVSFAKEINELRGLFGLGSE